MARAIISGVRRSWAMLSPTNLSWSSRRSISSSIRLTARATFSTSSPSLSTGRRELKIAVHDRDDGVVNALEPLRGAVRKNRADRQDHENSRQERGRQHAQHGLLQVVDLAQAAAEQHHAAVRTATGDEDGRFVAARNPGEAAAARRARRRRPGSAAWPARRRKSWLPRGSNRAT